jgi:hypothetical protein
MLDLIIVYSILSSVRERSGGHAAAETALFVVYLVVYVAAIVTATALRAARRGETVSIAIALNSPLVYFMLFPFGAFSVPTAPAHVAAH